MENEFNQVRYPEAIEQLAEIVVELEDALKKGNDKKGGEYFPEPLKVFFHEALTELSSVLGVVYGGKLNDPKGLEEQLRKANDCFVRNNHVPNSDYAEFGLKARLVINATIREIYKLAQTPRPGDRSSSSQRHLEPIHS